MDQAKQVSIVQGQTKHEKEFKTYYCSLCGTMALVTSLLLDDLKLRRLDNAYILECHTHFHKKYMLKTSRTTILTRDDGIEKQYRWECKECHFPLGY